MGIHRCRSDIHSHSSCSFDGSSSMEAMCRRASELGYVYYALTDHCECNKYHRVLRGDGPYRAASRAAYEEMKKCAEIPWDFQFLKGVELGQPLQNLEAAQEVVARKDYDIVIGSLHNINGVRDFYHMGQLGLSKEETDDLFTRYFREILDMIAWGDFDTLAHITYPLRYLAAPGTEPTFAGHEKELSAVMKALIAKGKALEFNTSRLLAPDAPRLPDLETFSLYHELGGRLVTLGADAHCVENVGKGIDEAMDILAEAGFTEHVVYVNRKPVLLPLE